MTCENTFISAINECEGKNNKEIYMENICTQFVFPFLFNSNYVSTISFYGLLRPSSVTGFLHELHKSRG